MVLSEWPLLAYHDYWDPSEDDEIDRYRDGDSDPHSLSGSMNLDRTFENPPLSLLSQRHPGDNVHTTSNNDIG